MKNKQEKKYLLALESGRVNVRQGRCPVPGCGKETTRLDRHIQAHTELSKAERANTITACKQRKVLDLLGALRASNPEVPMISTLDLERDLPELEDPSTLDPVEEEEEREKACQNEACQRLVKRQRGVIADLNQQLDALTRSKQSVTRKYRVLRRRWESLGDARIKAVARRLLSSPGPEEKETEENVPRRPRKAAHLLSPPPPPPSPTPSEDCDPSASQPGPSGAASPPHYPDHVVVLSEYES
ncbi:MAG: hypothetical protein ACRCVK_07385 [Aeromonas veronii]